MKILLTKTALTVAAVLILSGCQSTHNMMGIDHFDEDWGHSYEAARYSQILHPEAGGDKPVMGLDGEASEKVYQQYRESFGQGGGQSSTGGGTSLSTLLGD